MLYPVDSFYMEEELGSRVLYPVSCGQSYLMVELRFLYISCILCSGGQSYSYFVTPLRNFLIVAILLHGYSKRVAANGTDPLHIRLGSEFQLSLYIPWYKGIIS